MNKDIILLDCTLRDGGYVNEWNFGHSTIACIAERLVEAGIDIIEVGFLDDRSTYDINKTLMPDTASLNKIFGDVDKKNAMLVAMIDYGTCSIEHIAPRAETVIDGIRIIFKKNNMHSAVAFGHQVRDKGYKVCMQLVSITSYADKDILELCDLMNDLKPYAVSIVDTYGLMHKEKLFHYYDMLNNNLDPNVIIGFHSHNNFQLAYANTIELMKVKSKRPMMVDGTVYGMGKSAGNAPIELLAMHLNENYGSKYGISHLLEIIDVNVMKIYEEQRWGYSLKFYLSASNECHPSYIDYLLNKKTLSVMAINEIVQQIIPANKLSYNQAYISELYTEYQRKNVTGLDSIGLLKSEIGGKKLLLLGPGKTLKTNQDMIRQYAADHDVQVVSINFFPEDFRLNYVFINNAKRYNLFFDHFKRMDKQVKIISTSNISSINGQFDFRLSYDAYLDQDPAITDNSLIMFLHVLREIGVKQLVLAGFDGFAVNSGDNYYDGQIDMHATGERLRAVNVAVQRQIQVFQKDMDITFLTRSIYEGSAQ